MLVVIVKFLFANLIKKKNLINKEIKFEIPKILTNIIIRVNNKELN